MYSSQYYYDGDNPKVLIESGLLSDLSRHIEAERFSKVAILTDQTVAGLWLSPVREALRNSEFHTVVISAGESSKSVQVLEQIWTEFHNAGLDRHSLLVSLGGGCVLDVGGLAASTYMRGLSLINIPTTLLAQVDASFGGKTAVNFRGVKNLIGTFYHPKKVLIDPIFLSTQPKKDIISGSAEVIKHALLAGSTHLDELKNWNPLETESEKYFKILQLSCQFKLNVVSSDSKETGRRKLLNFGHTAGHAFEALSLSEKEPLSHGEAVAIGMHFESLLASFSGLLSSCDLEYVRNLLLSFGLPIHIEFRLDPAQFFKLIGSDKKIRAGELKWTLLRAPGDPIIDVEVPEEHIVRALSEVCRL